MKNFKKAEVGSTEEKKADKSFFSNRICAVPMCQKPGVAKNNVTGAGQWYCSAHSLNPNAAIEPAHFEGDWREDLIKAEREAHPERERQPGESREEFAKRSIAFLREKIGMIGSC